MNIEITVSITAPDGTVHTETIGALDKSTETIGDIGLSIREGKDLLLKLQQEIGPNLDSQLNGIICTRDFRRSVS